MSAIKPTVPELLATGRKALLAAVALPGMVLLLSACSLKLWHKKPALHEMVARDPAFSDHFTGFVLYDPATGKYLENINGEKYFTPASNTKLFTYYAGLKILGDSLPALRYAAQNDTLYFSGTGDPTFLHPDFHFQPAWELLSGTTNILVWQPENYSDPAFGPGWAWDDYAFSFQPERAGFPLYGNIVRFALSPGDSMPAVQPPLFQNFVENRPYEKYHQRVERDLNYNSFVFINPETRQSVAKDVPFKYSHTLAHKLLQDTLHRSVLSGRKPCNLPWKLLKGYPAQEVYRAMLQPSDNFLAEQILIMCSSLLGDTLSGMRTIRFTSNKYLQHLPQPPQWHDGSGLSRYNMFTPLSMVALLTEISTFVKQEELFRTLAIGGVAGTLRGWYKQDGEPYVFAKTGTLTGVHALSGFVRCHSGKVLIFSFMHNNHTGSIASIRQQMQVVLERIRDEY